MCIGLLFFQLQNKLITHYLTIVSTVFELKHTLIIVILYVIIKGPL